MESLLNEDDKVDDTLYLSALYEYIKQTERKISNESDGYPPWEYQERIIRLLCTFVESEWGKSREQQKEINRLTEMVGYLCDKVATT